jgi:hypothetical protein
MKKGIFFIAIISAILNIAPAFSQILPLSPSKTQRLLNSISDDSSLRLQLKESVFRYKKDDAANLKKTLYTLPTGERVELRVESNDSTYTFILAREIAGNFPGWARGSWLLTKSKIDNSFVRIRVFLRSDPYAFIDFRPRNSEYGTFGNDIFGISDYTPPGETQFAETLGIPFPIEKEPVTLNTIHGSELDIVLYDAYIARGLPVPFSFEQLLTEPLYNVITSLGDTFPRRYFEIETGFYRDIVSFLPKLRASLRSLNFRDDGAIDEFGNYVFIDSLEKQDGKPGLNCSGFAKFVVDGILMPLTKNRLPIPPLKQKRADRGSNYTDIYEARLDPFFGLDWTRNLAQAANSAFKGNSFLQTAEFEVRSSPFAELIYRTPSGSTIRSAPGYIPNAGYTIESLQPLLYTLAVDDPGKIYLASVNNESGERASIRRHFHIAVLVPYFDANGTFHILCFESAEETTFNRCRIRYPGHMVNLVGIPVEGNFY